MMLVAACRDFAEPGNAEAGASRPNPVPVVHDVSIEAELGPRLEADRDVAIALRRKSSRRRPLKCRGYESLAGFRGARGYGVQAVVTHARYSAARGHRPLRRVAGLFPKRASCILVPQGNHECRRAGKASGWSGCAFVAPRSAAACREGARHEDVPRKSMAAAPAMIGPKL